MLGWIFSKQVSFGVLQKSVSWSNNFSMIGRSPRHKDWSRGLCIKVGRGQGGWGIGTREWGLATWGGETKDLWSSNMGRGGRVGRGRRTLNTGMRECQIQGRGGCE